MAQRIFVNRIFEDATGSPLFNPAVNPLGIHWSKTIPSASGGIIMVGNTSVSGQGQNIYIVKYNAGGAQIFQSSYNTSSSNNDYGTGVYEASNGDIYVSGTTDNGGTTNYDAVILRYNSSGTLLNSVTRDGPASLNDAAVSVIKLTSGNIYVAANTSDANSLSDFWLIKYTSSLSFLGETVYDYAGLNDFALGLFESSGVVKIIGASAPNASSCDYVQTSFNASSLNYISETRSNIPGTAFDQALDFCKDPSDNSYVTGKTWNGSDFDIKTIRINANMSLSWTASLNHSNAEDAGTSVCYDGNGNIIVGGYVTKSNSNRDLVCIKYNAANGNPVWTSPYYQSSENPAGDAYIKKIFAETNSGSFYFTAGEKNTTGDNQVLLGKIDPDGNTIWQRKIARNGQDILPSDILASGDSIYTISVLDSTTGSYIISKYEEMEMDSSRSFSGGQPSWPKQQLIVGFFPAAIDTAAINNHVGTKILEAGNLSEFLTPTAFSQFTLGLEGICRGCTYKAAKIHRYLKTTDTVTISRLGQPVLIPSFWADLLLEFPASITIQQAHSKLKDLGNLVVFSHPNYFTHALSVPNDSLYGKQKALKDTSAFAADINVEEAWNIAGSGRSTVKGGVFDTGVHWKHEDFGYNGISTSSKINGWHFFANGNDADIKTVQFPDTSGHGTGCAAIIGALRNNTKGIAGVAGGDGSVQNPGVSLFSLNTIGPPIDKTIEIITQSSFPHQFSNFSYGLNFGNHSWGINLALWPDTQIVALSNAYHFANKMQITAIIPRGNAGYNSIAYPSNFDTTWVLSVGGTGSNGLYKDSTYEDTGWAPSYGPEVDVAAPCVHNMVWTCGSSIRYGTAGYGTSISAPYVSGVVALLMGYINDSTGANSYQNLAPEDCEFIIERSATDVGATGYDQYTGYGRLNAGKALRMVEKPYHILYHFGTNNITPHSFTKQVYSNSDTITLTDVYDNRLNSTKYRKGRYIVKTFQIDASVSHPGLYASDSLMYYWPRHSSSYSHGLFDSQKKLDLHERAQIISLSPGSATIRGYVYQVWDTLGNPRGWWPCDTSLAPLFLNISKPNTFMEYSILTKNKAVGIRELIKDNENTYIRIFPNPAKQLQIISLENEKDSHCTIDLYDLMGRHIRSVYKSKVASGRIEIEHDVTTLLNSMYLYVIKLDDKLLTKKFIKE